MLISGVIASTLLIGAMSVALLLGVILIPIDRHYESHREHT